MVLSFTLTAQGIVYMSGGPDLTLVIYALILLSVASGVSLLIGFLTPVAAILAGVSALCTVLSSTPMPNSQLFDSRFLLINVVVMAAAVAFLGPGAFSLDARLFGRREIIIARRPDSSKL